MSLSIGYGLKKISEDELQHHGILGMRWGVRRFQNSDGTLTAAGKKRANKYRSKAYTYAEKGEIAKAAKSYLNATRTEGKTDNQAIREMDGRWVDAKRKAAQQAKSILEGISDSMDDDRYFMEWNRYASDRDKNMADAMRKYAKDAPDKEPVLDGLPFSKWVERESKYADKYITEYDKKFNKEFLFE